MRKLIWNNISKRQNQSLLTIAIAAIAVMTFVLVLGVFVTMDRGLAASKSRLGADCIFIPSEANASGYELLFTANPENVYMSTDVMDKINQLEGVEKISPQFFSQTLRGGCCDFGLEMRVVGIDPETDFVVKNQMNISNKEQLTDEDIVLGGEFVDFVGSKSTVLNHQFNVIGELYPTGTGMDKTIYMTIDMARKVTAESDKLDVLPEDVAPSKLISCVMVKLEDGVDASEFAYQFKANNNGIDAQCIATTETIAALEEQLETTMKVLLGLCLAALIIAALALIGRFNALAKDRKKEIGLLRAIGIQKKQVFGLVIGEACTMAVIGGVIGSIAAGVAMNYVLQLIQTSFQLPPSSWSLTYTLLSMLAGVILAALMGFLAALKPAIASANLEPQTAITEGEVN